MHAHGVQDGGDVWHGGGVQDTELDAVSKHAGVALVQCMLCAVQHVLAVPDVVVAVVPHAHKLGRQRRDGMLWKRASR